MCDGKEDLFRQRKGTKCVVSMRCMQLISFRMKMCAREAGNRTIGMQMMSKHSNNCCLDPASEGDEIDMKLMERITKGFIENKL